MSDYDTAPAEDYSCAPDTSTDYSCAPDTSTNYSCAPDTSTGYSCAPDTSTGYSCAPVTSVECPCSAEPQRDYEACVSETKDTTPMSEDSPAEASSLDDILHDTTLNYQFLDVTQESEHRHHSNVSTFSRYYPRSSYTPSYKMNRPNTSQRHVYRNATHGRNELNNVHNQVTASQRRKFIRLRVLTAIGAFIIFVMFLAAISIYVRNYYANTTKIYGQKPEDGESQGHRVSVPDFSTAHENLMKALRTLDKFNNDPFFKRRDHNTKKPPVWK